MTLGEIQESGYKRTTADIKKFYGMIAAEYQKALDDINKDIRKIYDKVIGNRSPAEVSKLIKEQPNWMWVQANKFDRLQSLQKRVQEQFIKTSIKAGNMTVESSKMAITNNFYRQQFATATAAPALSFSVLNPAVVEVSVLGTRAVWEKIGADTVKRVSKKYGSLAAYQPKYGSLTEVILKNRRQQLQQIQSAITQGLIQGKGAAKTAQDVRRIMNNSVNDAVRIVRTESMRNMNAGAFANYNTTINQGIEMERKIIAVLDDRTRPQSARVDDEIATEDGFLYPDGNRYLFPGNTGNPAWDINDRETVINIVEGQGPETRRGRNPVTGETEVFSWKSYDEWAKGNGVTPNATGRLVIKR